MKKIFTTIFLMMVTVVTWAYDFAVDEIYYNLNSIDMTAGVAKASSFYIGPSVVIPSSITYNGNTYVVTSIDNDAFDGCSNLLSVTIPNTVTKIGDSSFKSCHWLSSVNIPENVTSIGNFAFQTCESLKSVELPKNLISIGDYAFNDCALTSITLPEGLQSIGKAAFRVCHLTSIYIPSSVTEIGASPFSTPLADLITITIDENNPVYNSVGNAIIETKTKKLIQGCNYTVIPDDITSISESAFYSCTKLTSVTIPNTVTNIGSYAFSGCI